MPTRSMVTLKGHDIFFFSLDPQFYITSLDAQPYLYEPWSGPLIPGYQQRDVIGNNPARARFRKLKAVAPRAGSPAC